MLVIEESRINSGETHREKKKVRFYLLRAKTKYLEIQLLRP